MSGLTLDKIKYIDTIPLNFVMGKERSGTTLLQVMLNTHPNIIAPPESRFIMLLHSRYGHITQWTEHNLTRFCNDIMQEKPIETFWAINRQDLLASCLAAKDIATYPLLCKLVFYHSSPDKDVKMFFDKNPIYAYFLPELRKLFPDAKYIHIVRDYRANIVSHRRVFAIKQSADITYRWLQMNMLIEEAKSQNKENYFTQKYENLVSEPIKSVADICSFLQIPFDEKMAVQHSSGIFPGFKANKKERFQKIHQSVFTPITSSFVNKWEKTLTPQDIAEAENIAGDYAEKMYAYKKHSGAEIVMRQHSDGFMMKLKYRAIKNLYMLILKNPWLYFKIKKYVWKYF
jgi:hypothetical protein